MSAAKDRVAASAGGERSGPTAVLNSVAKLNASKSWQCGYQVNLRLHSGLIAVAKGTTPTVVAVIKE